MTEKERLAEFVDLKRRHNLTNRGVYDALPAGTASFKTVESWSSGRRSIPPLVLKVLKHILEGEKIK